jgi:selenocysteine-specific elongation factor
MPEARDVCRRVAMARRPRRALHRERTAMARSVRVIVGTAGHVDHGKSTLVRALTGVDTDRLREEKQRGMTIELGFAYLDTPCGTRLGFVDVPGHERLLATMLAGAANIEFALLVVAADDGVMAQTREHVAALSLLDVRRGAVALTKCDRVDAARVDACVRQIRALLAASELAAAPILPVAAPRGDGIRGLRDALIDAAHPLCEDDSAFRMAVDRSFTLDGLGSVATGFVRAGRVQAADELTLLPQQVQVRVRSVHANGRPAQAARRGERCALVLHGVNRDQVRRGQWLVDPAVALTTDRIDVVLQARGDMSAPLRSGTTAIVHLGTAAVPGRVVLLESDALEPAAAARAQLVLQETIAAWHGDRILLRDPVCNRLLAGAVVLDPQAPARYRRAPQRLAQLEALAIADAPARTAALLAVSDHGLDGAAYARAQGRALAAPARALVAGGYWLGEGAAARLREATLAALQAYHETCPDDPGPDPSRLRRMATPRLPAPLHRKLIETMRNEVLIASVGSCLCLPQHGIRLTAQLDTQARRIEPLLDAAGPRGAWVRDLAMQLTEPERRVRGVLCAMARAGRAIPIVADLYCTPRAVVDLAATVRALAAARGGEVSAAGFRDATRLGRNRAVQVLEYFDRVGLLRRVGATHRLRSDCERFAPPGGVA